MAERHLIIRALPLLFALGQSEPGHVTAALTHIAQGDSELRLLILSLLTEAGLSDPHGYLSRELSKTGTAVRGGGGGGVRGGGGGGGVRGGGGGGGGWWQSLQPELSIRLCMHGELSSCSTAGQF